PNVTPQQIQDYFAKVTADRERLVRLPQVAEAGRAAYIFLAPDKDGKELGAINAFAAADGHVFRTMDRPKVLQGRFARLDRPDEAIVAAVTARFRYLHVGSRVTLWSYSAQTNELAAVSSNNYPPPDGPA